MEKDHDSKPELVAGSCDLRKTRNPGQDGRRQCKLPPIPAFADRAGTSLTRQEHLTPGSCC